MKKLTALARVIDVFSTEPIEKLDDLLAAAQQIAKSRKARNTPERQRRQKADPSVYQEEAKKS